MPSLTDPFVQRIYVNHVVNLYKSCPNSPARRKQRFEAAVRDVANVCSLPIGKMIWCAEGGFIFQDWRLELDKDAVTLDPNKELRKWMSTATTPYHELRHLEQSYLMAQAILKGVFDIPVQAHRYLPHVNPIFTMLRAAIARIAAFPVDEYGRLSGTKQAALRAMGFPEWIIVRADHVKEGFPNSLIAPVKYWMDSEFGHGEKARDRALNDYDKGGAHRRAYFALPEEADAFAVEREVSLMIRAAINEHGVDQGCQGLRLLFQK